MLPLQPRHRELPFPTAAAFLVFAVVAAVRLAYLAGTGITYEDSLITLRYAENMARGLGPVYNPGERVLGASTPFYMLLLAALAGLRLPDPLLVAKLLCVAADGLTAVLWVRFLCRETGAFWAGAFFAVAFSLSPFLVQNSVAGMEPSLALLFLTGAFVADRADRPALLGSCLGLLMLVRPDGILAALVILGVRAGRERRCPWRAAGAAALVLLPWFAFALSYYGTVVPNTVFAKAAAYNAHIQGIQRNLLYTLNQFAPWSSLRPEFLFNLAIAPLLLLGAADVLRHRRRLLAIPLFWLAWWAYLVLPRTVLFLWYYPPMTSCAYVLAAIGFSVGMRRLAAAAGEGPVPRLAGAAVLLYLVACGVPWLLAKASRARVVQAAEDHVRQPLGRWLARNTPPAARIAMEPIGYIGYYSGRPVLDEIGLVSPAMIPFTRSGAGWFGRAMQALRPDYVVERPWYLERNRTIITGLPMFATDEDRAWFFANYQPVGEFPEGGPLRLPDRLDRDYRFIVYRRTGAG
jgi:hypothetical protein